jgi:hypothetical protein
MQEDACPHLDGTLHSLAMLALDEVKAAEKAGEELWQEFRAAKGFPEPEMRRDRTRTG